MGRLVRLYPGRPAFVGPVCISVHDTWHLLQRAKLRRQILEAPPGSRHKLMAAIDRYRAFEASERAWYQRHGLQPPDVTKMAVPTCKVGHVLEPGQRQRDCLLCNRALRRASWRRLHPKKPPSMTEQAIAMRARRAKSKRVGAKEDR